MKNLTHWFISTQVKHLKRGARREGRVKRRWDKTAAEAGHADRSKARGGSGALLPAKHTASEIVKVNCGVNPGVFWRSSRPPSTRQASETGATHPSSLRRKWSGKNGRAQFDVRKRWVSTSQQIKMIKNNYRGRGARSRSKLVRSGSGRRRSRGRSRSGAACLGMREKRSGRWNTRTRGRIAGLVITATKGPPRRRTTMRSTPPVSRIG